MKFIAFVGALMFASSVSLAQSPDPSRDQICYGWLSNTPVGVNRLVAKEVNQRLKAAKIPAAQRGRILICLAGAVHALHQPIREQCVIGADPRPILLDTLATAEANCIAESGGKPQTVVPGPADSIEISGE